MPCRRLHEVRPPLGHWRHGEQALELQQLQDAERTLELRRACHLPHLGLPEEALEA